MNTLIESIQVPDQAIAQARINTGDSSFNIWPITLPSGRWVIIREQNGEDDGTLSTVASQKDATGINMFIRDIIVYSPWATTKGNLLTLEDILSMPLRDKYTIMVKSRILSLGSTLTFPYNWPEAGLKEYEEDLLRFVQDFEVEPIPEDSPDFDPERVQPYLIYPIHDPYIYFNLDGKVSVNFAEVESSTLKVLRFRLLDGNGERELLAAGDDMMNINTKIKARDLQIYQGGNWQKIEQFKMFKSAEMNVIRHIILTYDKEFDGYSEILSPDNKNKVTIPILTIPSFFYPLPT